MSRSELGRLRRLQGLMIGRTSSLRTELEAARFGLQQTSVLVEDLRATLAYTSIRLRNVQALLPDMGPTGPDHFSIPGDSDSESGSEYDCSLGCDSTICADCLSRQVIAQARRSRRWEPSPSLASGRSSPSSDAESVPSLISLSIIPPSWAIPFEEREVEVKEGLEEIEARERLAVATFSAGGRTDSGGEADVSEDEGEEVLSEDDGGSRLAGSSGGVEGGGN
jgi:hypothetical protein